VTRSQYDLPEGAGVHGQIYESKSDTAEGDPREHCITYGRLTTTVRAIESFSKSAVAAYWRRRSKIRSNIRLPSCSRPADTILECVSTD